MIVYPAVDLREGCCVQLVGGSYDNELVRLDDPVGVAKNWKNSGFGQLHIIDLDRAMKKGNNIDVVSRIIGDVADSSFHIRVGGGIATNESIDELLVAGANSLVIGSRGVRDFDWFSESVRRYPGQLYIALEVFERDVKVDGWQTSVDDDLFDLIRRYDALDIAGIFVTAIHKEGLRQGTDRELFAEISSKAQHEVVASGGVTTIDDIDALSQLGVAQVVLGAALYTDENLLSQLQGTDYM